MRRTARSRPAVRRGSGLRWLPAIAAWLVLAEAAASQDAQPQPSEPDDVPAAAVIAELPFLDFDEPNRILLDLAPEGSVKPLRLLLDTGASDSVVTPGVARELGVRVRRTKSTPYRRRTVLDRDLQFWIDTRGSDLGSATGWEYGLLGGTFLARYVVELDFAARRVRFLDARRYRVPEQTHAADEAVVALSTPANRPHVRMHVDGQIVRALVDTGDPFPAGFIRSRAEALGLVPKALHGLEIWGVRGRLSDTSFAEVGRLGFGTLSLDSVPVVLTGSSYNQGDSSGAVVGYDVLSQFLVRIDYPRRRMWLRRNAGRPPTFLGMSWDASRDCGAFLDRRGVDLWVRYVLDGSAAHRLGLQPGDRLVAAPGAGELDEIGMSARIAEGGPVEVLRESDGGFVRVALPAPVAPPE